MFDVEAVSEQRRLELMVIQAKLMQVEWATKSQITDLRQALAEAQFRMTMVRTRYEDGCANGALRMSNEPIC